MDKTRVLKAMSDETRMKILTLLLRHSYCVRALASKLELTEATISQHLKLLREAGLLEGEKRGSFMHYDVKRDALRKLAGEIEALAAIEREACNPGKREDCPAANKQGCHKKGACTDEVKEFCHGKNHGEEDGRHGHCQGRKS